MTNLKYKLYKGGDRLKAENIIEIVHAGKRISEVFSQDSFIWGENSWTPRHTVRFQVTIPSNVDGSISIFINGKMRRQCRVNESFNIIVKFGDEIKVVYSLRTSGYKFFSNTPKIEEGVFIRGDCDIWIGFNKLNEDIA